MKIALLMSGYLRTFKDNASNIKKFLIDPFETIDVYVHITKHEADDHYLNPQNLKEAIACVELELSPICVLVEDNGSYSYDNRENNTINLWSKFDKLNGLKKQHETEFGEYDIVIKTRPDVAFTDLCIKTNIDSIHIPRSSKIDRAKLNEPNDKHVCDIFAYGPSRLMDQYFGIYDNIRALIKKYGPIPETLLWHHLSDSCIPYKLVDIEYGVILSSCNAFAIAGDSGSGKSTLGNLLKAHFKNSFLLECDRYHKWERHDENWRIFTHLNPHANYITKMTEDVFNLKLGNSILQVDYDHTTGKFTEKERINPADSIIVCGLHSLYDNTGLYDVKVFMDTAEDLRVEWKCNRDSLIRGYTKEDVLKQIRHREEDYKKYVLPQREHADIIVNFYMQNDEVKLRMSIKKSLNIKKILQAMEPAGVISHYFTSIADFHIIEFSKYKHNNAWCFVDEKEKLLYNYVLYVLLNLGITKS